MEVGRNGLGKKREGEIFVAQARWKAWDGSTWEIGGEVDATVIYSSFKKLRGQWKLDALCLKGNLQVPEREEKLTGEFSDEVLVD
ncbi:hypothetical protein GOP47_0018732 [Adiantum capillus-veneris]|uniref:Uncharacterized protein n=1 Tax=Adiantum capillus-veneris TaxID=13818 RepID=A0A9D4UEP8_ADICA|nr:hypothetical protein GOP47_0018732 [Adiantum capillus-veneris]